VWKRLGIADRGLRIVGGETAERGTGQHRMSKCEGVTAAKITKNAKRDREWGWGRCGAKGPYYAISALFVVELLSHLDIPRLACSVFGIPMSRSAARLGDRNEQTSAYPRIVLTHRTTVAILTVGEGG